MRRTLTTLFLLSALPAFGEYRAYQYAVVNKVVFDGQPKTVLVTTTMDPRTYVAYNGGYGLINVDLLRTWICPGHTGKRAVCPSPYARLSEEALP